MKKLWDNLEFLVLAFVLLIIGYGIATHDNDKSFRLSCVPIETTVTPVSGVELDCTKVK
ncbi:MAG: hypothetical protein HZC02_05410 [Candidatus Levybacteria bacterium]|nr:hypothetical protein [Candidatus Levybacteria bacterium]